MDDILALKPDCVWLQSGIRCAALGLAGGWLAGGWLGSGGALPCPVSDPPD